MYIFYESGDIRLRNISVATQRVIKLVGWRWMFGFFPRGWSQLCNLCWTSNAPLFVFDMLYNIILLLSLVATLSFLILQRLGN